MLDVESLFCTFSMTELHVCRCPKLGGDTGDLS